MCHESVEKNGGTQSHNALEPPLSLYIYPVKICEAVIRHRPSRSLDQLSLIYMLYRNKLCDINVMNRCNSLFAYMKKHTDHILKSEFFMMMSCVSIS